MNRLTSLQQLKETIQQFMIDVTGPSYTDIRAKSESFVYFDISRDRSVTYELHLSVEAEGSQINVSPEDFVSTIDKYMHSDPRDFYHEAETSEEERNKILMFREANEAYKQNVMYEYNYKKMYCAVSISVKRPHYY